MYETAQRGRRKICRIPVHPNKQYCSFEEKRNIYSNEALERFERAGLAHLYHDPMNRHRAGPGETHLSIHTGESMVFYNKHRYNAPDTGLRQYGGRTCPEPEVGEGTTCPSGATGDFPAVPKERHRHCSSHPYQRRGQRGAGHTIDGQDSGISPKIPTNGGEPDLFQLEDFGSLKCGRARGV